MFAWLISHSWNYCWLICCERKILFIVNCSFINWQTHDEQTLGSRAHTHFSNIPSINHQPFSLYEIKIKMSRAMPPPLTVLERGFLRWPRHVTRLDFRRHQQVTRYVLKGWNGPSGVPWNHLFSSTRVSWAFQYHCTEGQNKRDQLAIFFRTTKSRTRMIG
jgi:hypothetical protein